MAANENSHKGSRAWWASMTPEEKKERARNAAKARWGVVDKEKK